MIHIFRGRPTLIVTICYMDFAWEIPYWEIQDTSMFLTSNHYPCYYNYYDCYGAYVNFVSIGACVDFDLGMGSGTIPDSNINASSVQSVSTPAKNGRLNLTHQDHHGVQEQVTLTHIYRLIYRHFISSVLCPLKGILKQIIGWRPTFYNYPQMGQLGQIIRKLDRLRYATWAGWELYHILTQSLFLSFDNIDTLISKSLPKEL